MNSPNQTLETNCRPAIPLDVWRQFGRAVHARAFVSGGSHSALRSATGGLMPDRFRVRCDAVKYRQGFIEVIGGIHPGLVNMETWQVCEETDISGRFLESDEVTDDDIDANTELELTPAQARSLAAALLSAADAAEVG